MSFLAWLKESMVVFWAKLEGVEASRQISQHPATTSTYLCNGDSMQAPSLWGLPVYESIELLLSCHEIHYQDLLHALHGMRQDRISLLPEEPLKFLHVCLHLD